MCIWSIMYIWPGKELVRGGRRMGPPTVLYDGLRSAPMPNYRIEPEGEAGQLFAIRLSSAQRAKLDEMVTENPDQTRSGILRAAFDEYLRRHSTSGAA
jgi:hypothetical protein